MKQIVAISGLVLITYGVHQLWGAWGDIVVGTLLLIESYSLKTGERNDP
jgi:hypothetical protein